MKILHINQSDVQGGAAIAAYRLHKELLHRSAQSRLIVRRPISGDAEVESMGFRRVPDGILAKASSIVGLNDLFTYRSYKLHRRIWYREADVLNLHNLHPGYFNYLSLPALTRNKPAIHTLHDMWAITGHCAYSYDCVRWQNGCGKCPSRKEYPEIGFDNTRLALKLKKSAYMRSNIHLVAPSRWLMGLLEKSILSGLPRHHIPNGINLEVYKPLDSGECRKLLGLPPRTFVVMFAAESLADRRKGARYLNEAISLLPSSLQKQVVLLGLGRGSMSVLDSDLATCFLGYVHNDHLKAIAYSAADLFLFTSVQDNLPLVLQESMACGTPMIAFDVGGVSDLVRDSETGSLVGSGDVQAFAARIEALLQDDNGRRGMGERCRKIAESEYSIELQADRYLELYRSVIGENCRQQVGSI